VSRQQRRAAQRAETKDNKATVAMLEEQVKNLNSWVLGQIRANEQQAEHLNMMTTVVVLITKQALGKTLTDEEVAALKEAVGDGVKAVQGTDGEAARVDGDSAGVADQGVADRE
jgi:hypothetical protein